MVQTVRKQFWYGVLFAQAVWMPQMAMSDGWTTDCSDDGARCTAIIALANTETNKPLASIGIQAGKNGSEPAMIAIVPTGVELKPGFRAVIGTEAFDAPYEACFADGCRAVAPITDAGLETWLSAPSVSLQFFPYGSDKPVSADVPLTGLREALKDVLPVKP